jgi:hypothetical protein
MSAATLLYAANVAGKVAHANPRKVLSGVATIF